MTASKRILVLSLYYPPDLSACSFRTVALITALRRQAPDARIDVITSQPNRYRSFSSEVTEEETDGLTTIRRIRLPSHGSDLVVQAKAYAHFAWTASQLVQGRHYDLVFATSSRLMTAALGSWIARRLRAPLYLDIRDIFVDTLSEILPRKVSVPLKPLFSAIERWTIAGATHVNLVSQGFAPHFDSRYPGRSFSYFTNGIDEAFLPERLPPMPEGRHAPAAEEPLTVVYAGNMGQGQGLHAIVPAVARQLRGRVQFKLIGDGGRREQLERALADSGATNVRVVPPMSRDALIAEYLAADVLFLHLNDYEAFKKVLPSKVFEYGALGKPIWAGVAGYSAQFLREEVSNVAVFPPCQADEAVRAFEQLEIRDEPRDAFIRKFGRATIMRDLATDILRFASPGPAA